MMIGSQIAEPGNEAMTPSRIDTNTFRRPMRNGGTPTWISVKWHEVVEFLVPVGYEDEAGFHYGIQKSD